jgi:hypothetical protein
MDEKQDFFQMLWCKQSCVVKQDFCSYIFGAKPVEQVVTAPVESVPVQ